MSLKCPGIHIFTDGNIEYQKICFYNESLNQLYVIDSKPKTEVRQISFDEFKNMYYPKSELVKLQERFIEAFNDPNRPKLRPNEEVFKEIESAILNDSDIDSDKIKELRKLKIQNQTPETQIDLQNAGDQIFQRLMITCKTIDKMNEEMQSMMDKLKQSNIEYAKQLFQKLGIDTKGYQF